MDMRLLRSSLMLGAANALAPARGFPHGGRRCKQSLSARRSRARAAIVAGEELASAATQLHVARRPFARDRHRRARLGGPSGLPITSPKERQTGPRPGGATRRALLVAQAR